MIRKLNARSVGSLKPTPGRRSEYHDTEVKGLSLRVTERGAKSWTVLYRHRGRLRRLTLGKADSITLADARDRARDAIRDASKGADPAFEKQDRKRAQTIGDLADDYIQRYAKKHKRSWKHDEWVLRSKVLPHWRHRAIEDIARKDVRTLVYDIADGGAPILANRTAALLSKMFRFAMDDDLIEVNPAAAITRPAPEQKRDRVLSDSELRALWTALDALSPEMGGYFKLRAVTAQRGGEVAAMRWQDLDLEASWWTIPATVAKNKLAHRVPLSSMALDILRPLRNAAEKNAVYVLMGARGKRQQSEAAADFPVKDFRGHDLRRTAASLMTGGGIPRLVVSKILNHVEAGVTAIYDRHGYDAEKRAALDWWAVKLSAILDDKQDAAKVLPFQKGA